MRAKHIVSVTMRVCGEFVSQHPTCAHVWMMYGLCAHTHKHIRTPDDVIKWKHFPRYWPFVRRIHQSPLNSPHKGQWRGVLMFSLICAWLNGWVNNREVGDLRRHRARYDIIVMIKILSGNVYTRKSGVTWMKIPGVPRPDDILWSWTLIYHRCWSSYFSYC